MVAAVVAAGLGLIGPGERSAAAGDSAARATGVGPADRDGALQAGYSVANTAVARPNLVFIMLDDLGYGDLGSYGNRVIQTPVLDELAAGGMRFTQYYAAGPVCSPTRGSILTGLYPGRLNLKSIVRNDEPRGIPDYVTTLQEVLAEQGYITGHVGKWHLSRSRPEYLPIGTGFETSVALHRAGTPWSYFDPTLIIDGEEIVFSEGYLTNLLVDRAVEFIESSPPGPFFLNLWLYAPHFPIEPPEEWAARYPDDIPGGRAAMISNADEQIGRIVATLDQLGLTEQTLVVVTSDNGAARLDEPASGPLRGYKGWLLEGGIRVPMIASMPGSIEAGTVNDTRSSSLDWFPTMADMLEIGRAHV